MFTLDQFVEICPNCEEPDEWAELISTELPNHGFETNNQMAMFIAQCAHESAEFNRVVENLNYSADRLKAVFPKYFRNFSPTKMQGYNRNPKAIANLVYANRMGNGDEESGDGYKFRGRGLIMVTGVINYMKCSEYLFDREEILLDDPDLLLTKPNALGSALWYWKICNLLSVDDINLATKKINGGLNGIEDRKKYYQKALNALE